MERDALGASQRLSLADPNAKQAVWNLLGRESKVGKQLFSLYYGGEARAPGVDAGNAYSDGNLEAYRKRLAAGYTPPKPAPKPKPVPKSRAHVEVPSPCPPPASPGAGAVLRFQGGKRTLAAIQKEAAGFELPPSEPKGPLLGEEEKSRLSMLMAYNGELPPSLAEMLQQAQRGTVAQQQTAAAAGAATGSGAKAQLAATFSQLGQDIQRKQAAVRAAGSEREADRLRVELRRDLQHMRQVEKMLSRLEAVSAAATLQG